MSFAWQMLTAHTRYAIEATPDAIGVEIVYHSGADAARTNEVRGWRATCRDYTGAPIKTKFGHSRILLRGCASVSKAKERAENILLKRRAEHEAELVAEGDVPREAAALKALRCREAAEWIAQNMMEEWFEGERNDFEEAFIRDLVPPLSTNRSIDDLLKAVQETHETVKKEQLAYFKKRSAFAAMPQQQFASRPSGRPVPQQIGGSWVDRIGVEDDGLGDIRETVVGRVFRRTFTEEKAAEDGQSPCERALDAARDEFRKAQDALWDVLTPVATKVSDAVAKSLATTRIMAQKEREALRDSARSKLTPEERRAVGL